MGKNTCVSCCAIACLRYNEEERIYTTKQGSALDLMTYQVWGLMESPWHWHSHAHSREHSQPHRGPLLAALAQAGPGPVPGDHRPPRVTSPLPGGPWPLFVPPITARW